MDNKLNLTLKLKAFVPRQVLEDIFVTAIEGGSNDWYMINDAEHEKIRKAVPREVDPCLSTALFKAVYDHKVIINIDDIEGDEGEAIGFLDASNFQERLNKLNNDEDYRYALYDELSENGDANTSDIVFQYLVLGEVVYG